MAERRINLENEEFCTAGEAKLAGVGDCAENMSGVHWDGCCKCVECGSLGCLILTKPRPYVVGLPVVDTGA